MSLDLHHAHVFASNIEAAIKWWCEHMGAKVFFDDELAGSRNVFLAVGTGRLHIYDQAPKDRGRGGIHHLGVKVGQPARCLASSAGSGRHVPQRPQGI